MCSTFGYLMVRSTLFLCMETIYLVENITVILCTKNYLCLLGYYYVDLERRDRALCLTIC